MENPCPKTDDELIALLRGTKEQRDRAITCIYSHLGWAGEALALVQKKGGQREDALDAIGMAFEIFVRKVRDGSFLGNSKLKSYFIGICYFSWLRNKRPTQNIDWSENPLRELEAADFETPELLLRRAETLKFAQKLLEQFGEPCKSLLMDCYGGLSMAEIARTHGIESADAAKRRKFRCMEKLRRLISDLGLWDKLKDLFDF